MDIETRPHDGEVVGDMRPRPVAHGEGILGYDENHEEKQEETWDFDLRMETGTVRLNEKPQEYCLTEGVAPVAAHCLYLNVSDILRRLWMAEHRKRLVSCGPTLRPASASFRPRISAGGTQLELRRDGSAAGEHTLPSEYYLSCTTSQAKGRPLGMRAIRTSSCDVSTYSVENSVQRPSMEYKPIQPVRIGLVAQSVLPTNLLPQRSKEIVSAV